MRFKINELANKQNFNGKKKENSKCKYVRKKSKMNKIKFNLKILNKLSTFKNFILNQL
jgi:hypothetical protein